MMAMKKTNRGKRCCVADAPGTDPRDVAPMFRESINVRNVSDEEKWPSVLQIEDTAHDEEACGNRGKQLLRILVRAT